jgi:hypothetical protein
MAKKKDEPAEITFYRILRPGILDEVAGTILTGDRFGDDLEQLLKDGGIEPLQRVPVETIIEVAATAEQTPETP